jgi:hypothetical protein
MYLQSIKSVKHNAAKSVNRSILKKSRHLGFGVFIVHSSMATPILAWSFAARYKRKEPIRFALPIGKKSPILCAILSWKRNKFFTRKTTCSKGKRMSIATIRPLFNNPQLANPHLFYCTLTVRLWKNLEIHVNVCCCLGRFVLVTLYPSTTLAISFKGIGWRDE